MDLAALRARVRRHRHVLAVLAATAALFWVHDLFAFLTTTAYAGRDLAGNYAFTWLMHHNLSQGAVVLWTDRFLLGFPAFASYPPLFFMVPALAHLVTLGLVPLPLLFNATVFLSVLILPVLAFHAARPLADRTAASLAGAYVLFVVFVYPPVSVAYQTFSVGLTAQAFALLLLLAALGALLRDTRRTRILAGLLLAGTLLAHPFVGLTGFLVAAALAARHRDPRRLAPPALGLLLVAPWLVPAVLRASTLPAYTFAPARPGWVLAMLLPLIVLGGLRDVDSQALLGAFTATLLLAVVETPFIAQELRFYTYALLLGAVLAGLGAAALVDRLAPRFDRRILLAAVLLPVLALSLHAPVPATWSFQGDAEPLYDALDDLPQGDILVETSNTSIFDSYALQAAVPLRTHHDTANGVHVDQVKNARAILQAEHWVSSDPLHSPICANCSRTAPPSNITSRLDALGIDYVIARTATAAGRLNATLVPHGKHGDYWLFASPADGAPDR